VTRRRGGAPAALRPPAPTERCAPGAFWRPGPWACALALALVVSGCASKTPKPTPASEAVAAVDQVLAGMTEGLEAKDATALASQWDPSEREAARARIRDGLDRADGSGPADLRLTLLAVRAQGQRRLARVAWSGTWGGRKVAGTFEMELTGDDPPAIVALRGDDPVDAAATGPAEPSIPGAPDGAGELEAPAP